MFKLYFEYLKDHTVTITYQYMERTKEVVRLELSWYSLVSHLLKRYDLYLDDILYQIR